VTRLLAVATATAATGVAVLDGARVMAEVETDGARPHAAALLPAVERALADASLALEEIEAFALAIGPGSFTGLRIGLATVKAFALATPRLVAPVPTLAALAWPERACAEAAAGAAIVACLDARRGELYAAGFRAEGDGLAPLAELPESVWKPEALAARIDGRCVLVGEALEPVARALAAAGRAPLRALAAAPRVAAVGALGARMLARGEGRPAAELLPRYVRRAEAEARRTGQPLEPEAAARGVL
jgi:tRNA threonylcarbamoyladenosine biosynthesis protein TsaB